jgi:hypothetical protein
LVVFGASILFDEVVVLQLVDLGEALFMFIVGIIVEHIIVASLRSPNLYALASEGGTALVLALRVPVGLIAVWLLLWLPLLGLLLLWLLLLRLLLWLLLCVGILESHERLYLTAADGAPLGSSAHVIAAHMAEHHVFTR